MVASCFSCHVRRCVDVSHWRTSRQWHPCSTGSWATEMPRSQNAIFCGADEPDPEFDHPAGVSIARLLSSKLPTHGWGVSDPDCWRDAGWFLVCSRDDQSLDVVVVPHADSDRWIMQIAATRFPVFILRWLGAVPSADANAIFQLACDAHSILSSSGFTEFNWLWDGLPDSGDGDLEPQSAFVA